MHLYTDIRATFHHVLILPILSIGTSQYVLWRWERKDETSPPQESPGVLSTCHADPVWLGARNQACPDHSTAGGRQVFWPQGISSCMNLQPTSTTGLGRTMAVGGHGGVSNSSVQPWLLFIWQRPCSALLMACSRSEPMHRGPLEAV